MYSLEEKILLLGALFHDIGKFQQRCLNQKVPHEELGALFVSNNSDLFMPILDNNKIAYERFCKIIGSHHSKNPSDELIRITKLADHSSASERVEKVENEEIGAIWKHHFLSSAFSKINLRSDEETPTRYYRHELLTEKNYYVLIPSFETTEDALVSNVHYKNQGGIFESFISQLRTVLEFYETEDDFDTLINLILIVFEKYMWCIPDFTGSPDTDISLYNHSKDVAAISHALYKSRQSNKESSELNLIIGDMPGIQKYIFDITNKKPAKILRGRSIYVQLLTRYFSSIILKSLGLTETNLIMLAGGKFYLLAPKDDSFQENYENAVQKIEHYLIE
ncbi:MAG: type III-A CRISPR-associated protein Cas10/Csm1, partial [Bacteroidetes bacterium]|nr:type III-A CRISPR-associated protein Cas10/Csm1 [Bacteroidota bacterium]